MTSKKAIDKLSKLVKELAVAAKNWLQDTPKEPECKIPHGMLCWVWSDASPFKQLAVFDEKQFTANPEAQYRYKTLDNEWWMYCEPAWEAIFVLLGIPEEYQWIAFNAHTVDPLWFAYQTEPIFNGKSGYSSDKKEIGLVFEFHAHPDPVNSCIHRSELKALLGVKP